MSQVGLTEKGNLFVIVGSGRIWPEAFVEFTPKELKKLKVHTIQSIAVVVNSVDVLR